MSPCAAEMKSLCKEIGELLAVECGGLFSSAARKTRTIMSEKITYQSTQETECSGCGKRKHTPLRRDEMGGYVCLTCIDKRCDEFEAIDLELYGPDGLNYEPDRVLTVQTIQSLAKAPLVNALKNLLAIKAAKDAQGTSPAYIAAKNMAWKVAEELVGKQPIRADLDCPRRATNKEENAAVSRGDRDRQPESSPNDL
jgi:hypothetical protein